MKRKIVSLLAIVSLLLGAAGSARAQDRVKADLSLGFSSSYVWRGLNMGSTVLQPELSLSWKGLAFYVSGSAGLVDPRNEIDLTLCYTTGGLTIGVIDYWDDLDGTRFFDYRPKETGHSIEAVVLYDFGPVAVSWQTFFAGCDLQEADGRRAFSSYFEISAPFHLTGIDWLARAGFVPWASDYYGTQHFTFQSVSLKATKAISISDRFSLPIYGELIATPANGKLFFVAGLGIKFS